MTLTSVIHCPEVKAKKGSRLGTKLEIGSYGDKREAYLIRRGNISFFISGVPSSSITRAVPSVMLIGQKTCNAVRYKLQGSEGPTYFVRVADHQHHLRKAVDTAVLAVLALVEDPGKPFLLGYGFEIPPSFARLQSIDTSTPLVVLDELWWCDSIATA